jgi:hypothetical protein
MPRTAQEMMDLPDSNEEKILRTSNPNRYLAVKGARYERLMSGSPTMGQKTTPLTPQSDLSMFDRFNNFIEGNQRRAQEQSRLPYGQGEEPIVDPYVSVASKMPPVSTVSSTQPQRLSAPQMPTEREFYTDHDGPMPPRPKTPTTTGRVSAPAQTQPQNPNMYYYDPGDGGPMRTLGRSLPNGMSVGQQQGGGYISAVPIPMPTSGAQKFFQADYSGQNPVAKPQANVPMPPQRPANSGQPTPQAQPKQAPLPPARPPEFGSAGQPAGMEVPRDQNGNIIPTGNAAGGAIHQAHKVAKEKATPCHSGIINMAVGGRTDHIPMNVLEGSYVLPADIVSGLGEGNTLAGSKILDNMFQSSPYGAKTPNFKASPKFPSPAPMVNQPKAQAMGGRSTSAKSKPVPIIAAGGEYVVHPETVTQLGKGDMNAGHEYLDNFVKYVRAHTAKTLQNLPGPRKD